MAISNIDVFYLENHAYQVVAISLHTNNINEGESISNQPNLFPVEIHLFFFDVIAL